MKKMVKYLFLGLLLVLIIGYVWMRFGMSLQKSEQALQKMFANESETPSYHTYTYHGNTIHYADIGAKNLPVVLFIHGSPGSWDAYASYLADSLLRQKFRMIAVDRIGFGKSSPGQAEGSLKMQAEILLPILEKLAPHTPLILAGHSYGGPVALRFAADYPDKISSLLLLASSADPQFEQPYWIQWPLASRGLRWLLSSEWDVSNREILPLRKELESMKEIWENIRCEVVVMQGKKDALVHPDNPKFLEKVLTNARLMIDYMPEENHFIPWTQHTRVRDTLMNMIGRIYDGNEDANP